MTSFGQQLGKTFEVMTLRNPQQMENHRAFRTAAARCPLCVLITHRVLEENENQIDRISDRQFRSRTGGVGI